MGAGVEIASAHAVALDGGDDGHVAIQHGLQAAPHRVLVEGAQLRDVEAEVRVLGNVATGAEVRARAAQQYAAPVGAGLDAGEHVLQLAPHGAS